VSGSVPSIGAHKNVLQCIGLEAAARLRTTLALSDILHDRLLEKARSRRTDNSAEVAAIINKPAIAPRHSRLPPPSSFPVSRYANGTPTCA
jgi:hypothetical protein